MKDIIHGYDDVLSLIDNDSDGKIIFLTNDKEIVKVIYDTFPYRRVENLFNRKIEFYTFRNYKWELWYEGYYNFTHDIKDRLSIGVKSCKEQITYDLYITYANRVHPALKDLLFIEYLDKTLRF